MMNTHPAHNDFTWRWRDPSHLEAHRDEFARPVEEILEELRPLVAASRPTGLQSVAAADDTAPPPEDPRWLHADWELGEPTGRTGLRTVPPDGSESFWGYRRGRRIPSHLCLGRRDPTHAVCLWGWWTDDAFVIHTIYPGVTAPREIHDPEIALDALPAAIEFWRTHAIITTEGAYARHPDR